MAISAARLTGLAAALAVLVALSPAARAQDGDEHRGDLAPVVTPEQFGAACDSDGTPGSGRDDSAALQAAIKAAEETGGTLRLPGRPTVCRVTRTLHIRRHLVIDGDYCQPVRHNDGQRRTRGAGSWLYFDHPGVGLLQGESGTQVTGVVLQNFCTLRNQPDPVQTGAWAPADNDFDIVEQQDDLLIRNVMLLDPTRGVSASGRITIDGLRGQPLAVGLKIDRAHDIPRVDNVHWFPFWSNAPAVRLYTETHAEAFVWGRADNPFFSNSFALFVRTCVHLVKSEDGVTNKMHAVNIDCDLVGGDGWLNEARGSSGQIANFTTQGAGPIGDERLTLSGHGLEVAAANTVFSFSGLRATRFGGSAVVTAGGGNSLLLEALRVDGWGLTAPTSSAVVAGDDDAITVGAGAIIAGAPANGAIYGGAGTVSAVVTRKVN